MSDSSTMGNEPAGALTVIEFCETYRIGRNTFYGELKAGRLSAKKAGKKTLVLRAEAARWANALPEYEKHDTEPPPRSVVVTKCYCPI